MLTIIIILDILKYAQRKLCHFYYLYSEVITKCFPLTTCKISHYLPKILNAF